MKKIILLIILMIPFLCWSQYSIEYETWANSPDKDVWVFAGTLPQNTESNFQKLQIEVFGGQYVNCNGVTTYYISNRDGLHVNQVTMGGGTDNQFRLRAFGNSNGGVDFYIFSFGDSYTAEAVKSCLIGGEGRFFNTTGSGSAQHLFPSTIQPLAKNTLPSSYPEIHLTVNPVFITDANGNIALNSVAPDPAYKLAINGSIRAKEIKIETGWADYVFEKDYPLKSLVELKSFISKHHHLPDIPSAATVDTDGIELGKSISALLAKIEELTLYLLEKEEQLKLEQQRNDCQEMKIKNLEIKLNNIKR